MQKRLAVLVSGTGSILEAVLESGIEVCLVIADRQCPALEIAERKGRYQRVLMPRSLYVLPSGKIDRFRYTEDLERVLRREGIQLTMMAGFMTILDEMIFGTYPKGFINNLKRILAA
jgi:phosphoribosylglycinamide formyltransferase-1